MNPTFRATAVAAALSVSLLLVLAPSTRVGAVAAAVVVVDPATDPAFCRIDHGTSGQVADDDFYLSMDGDDDQVEVNDPRLSDFGPHAAGTLVAVGDAGEVASGSANADCQTPTVAYYDAHPNGRYDAGDELLMGYDKSSTTLVEGAANGGDVWVRVTAWDAAHPAGTIVFGDDPDFNAFHAGSLVPGAEFAYWDKDASTTWTPGDVGYITAKAVSTGDLVPAASVRVTKVTYAFGSQASFGDDDTTPALTDPATDVAICRIDQGSDHVLTNDGFYLSMNGDDDLVEANDLRLTPYGAHAAGTLVATGDTGEVNAAAACQAYAVAYYDRSGNQAYGDGDAVLLGYDKSTTSLVEPTTDTGDWWIRVTASGSHPAGTLVSSTDDDYLAYTKGTALAGAEFGFYDGDASGTFTMNDLAYITSAAIATGNRPPVFSARLAHTDYAFGTLVHEGDKDGPYLARVATSTATATTLTTTATSTTSTTTTTSPPTTTSTSTTTTPGQVHSTPRTGLPGADAAVAFVAVAAGLVVATRRT